MLVAYISPWSMSRARWTARCFT